MDALRTLGDSLKKHIAFFVSTAIVVAVLVLPGSAFAAAPTVALTAPTPSEGQNLTVNTASIGFTAAAAAPATIVTTSCKLDAEPAASCHSPRPYGSLADGAHTVSVIATDSNGEVGTAVRSFRVDTTPPIVTIGSPAEGQQIWGDATDVAFFAKDGGASTASSGLDRPQCRLDDHAPSTCSTTFATRLTGLSNGAHSYTVSAADVAGNSTTVVRNFSVSESGGSPSVGLDLSTTRATAHPDARITVKNSNLNEAIKAMRLRLPKGFWGSLTAAPKCDYAVAQSNNCAAASQIGTVDVDALIDASDARLRGKVFLTTPSPANVNNDPAGITVIVPTIVGGVNLGIVTVNARVQIRNAPVPGGAAGVVGVLEGMDAVVESVPNSHTDPVSGRTVTFSMKGISIDLISDLDGPNQPLLTNPTSCATSPISAVITSYTGKTASVVDPTPDNVTGCDTVKFSPSFDMVATTPAAGTTTGLLTDITLPPDNASFKSIAVRFPAMMGPAYASFGSSADQCESASATSGTAPFNPALCPPQAKFGTLTLDTPLLPGPPLQGNVYLINKSPLPWFGIDISPSVSATNPKGVTIRVVGQSATPQFDPACDASSESVGFCQTQISVTFNGIPDAPTTKISMNVNGPSRVGVGGVVLSGKFLAIADSGDSVCQAKDEFAASMLNNASNTIRGDRVKTQSFTGCGSDPVTIDDGASSPIGKTVTNAQPSVPYSGVASNCFFDTKATPVACGSPLTPSSALSRNVHRVFVNAGDQVHSRAFAVAAPPVAVDSTAPDTSFAEAVPPSITDATPTFSLAASEPSTFQCAIGPGTTVAAAGAYIACDPGAGNSAAGGFTVPKADELIAGKTYTLAVRAQDAAGNVDLTPATATFVVNVPFNAGINYSISTTAARGNPDLDLSITNTSHEDIKEMSIRLPDGFFGGLTGAALLCAAGPASTGDCTAESQIGTIETEAVIDESVVRLTGQIYLTEPLQPGDAAGLSIKLPAVLQSIDLGDIVVLARVNVRGLVQGLDTLVVQIPDHINPALSGNTLDADTQFDLRRITMKFRTNPAASYPLFTNASSCIQSAFQTDLVGYGGSVDSASEPYAVTNCDELPFASTLSASIVKEGTNEAPSYHDNVELAATVTTNPSDSALKNVAVTMPAPISIDVKRLGPVCEEAEMAANACPEATRVGSASAVSPLLLEPLSGGIYLLRAVAPYATPRLLITLRGTISVDIIAVNSFINGSKVLSAFTQLPDVPFTTFSMRFGGLLSIAYDPCESSETNAMVGTMASHNGKIIPVKNVLNIKQSCAFGKVNAKGLFSKGKKAKFTLKQPAGRSKTASLAVKLPRGASFIAAAAKRKIVITADRKKIKAKCFKVSKTTLTVNFCGKKVGAIVVQAKAGSILVTKTIAKPKLALTIVNAEKKRTRRTVNLAR